MRGWVEVKDGEEWWGSIEVYKLFCGAGNYEMFASLFGMRNYAQFVPIAEKRGMPPDVSRSFKEDYKYWEGHSATWLTYKEIKNTNWNETALKPCLDSKYKIKGGQFFREDASDNELTDEEQKSFYLGKSIEKNGYVYIPGILTRRSVLSWEWSLLFNIMCLLSEKYGDEEIRLVVFFEG
jgi:hypothetical protein